MSSEAKNGEVSFRKPIKNDQDKNDMMLSSIVSIGSQPRQMTYQKFHRPNTNKNQGGRVYTLFDNFKTFGADIKIGSTP